MIGKFGKTVIARGRDLLYSFGFFYQVLKETAFFIVRRQVGLRDLVMQILFTGVEAFGIVAFIALAIGAVIIVQGITVLPIFGQGDLVYSILIIVIMRELGPILTAFIITARSGTAIATELGGMVVSHEIEAYVSTGVDPIAYLAVPRVLGVTISLVVLTAYFNIFGLFGSYLVTQLVEPIQLEEYLRRLIAVIRRADVISSIVKSIVFGLIISTVATYQGFAVARASTEIPPAVIRAVGRGFVLCFLANAVITLIYYV